MKSGKQRRAELQLKKAAKRAKKEKEARTPEGGFSAIGGLVVDRTRLAPDGSYGCPEFVQRGFYVDVPFECQNCGVSQVWTAAQQKWWYEEAQGNVWTIAKLCRPCRQHARQVRETARRIHLEGIARRQAGGNA